MNAQDQLNASMYEFTKPKGIIEMLLYENLARARMREAEQAAREQRLARRLQAAKRWDRLAQWAAQQAARCAALL